MKNKGRKHKAGIGAGWMNCKGGLAHITRHIESMSSSGRASSKFDKKKWIKRIRGYSKQISFDKLYQP